MIGTKNLSHMRTLILTKEPTVFKDDPWSGIESGTYPSGRRLYGNDERYWVSRDSLNQLIFYVHDVCNTVIPSVEGPSSVGITVERYKANEQRMVCTFVDTSQTSTEKFALVVKHIALASEKFSGVALFTKIQKELHEWADFLKVSKQGLSRSELIGFWGELYVIDQYMMEHHNALDVIRYWAGPSGAPKDISFGSLAIEVKTTKVSNSRLITISSLDQLERTTDKLYLMHLFINDSDAESGLALAELYESIKLKIQHDLPSMGLYAKRAGCIFDRASSFQKEEPFLCSDVNMYDVLDDFPKLLRCNLEPKGILEAEYKISISSIQPFKVTHNLKDIIKNG